MAITQGASARSAKRSARGIIFAASAIVGAMVPHAYTGVAASPPKSATAQKIDQALPAFSPAEQAAQRILAARIQSIGRAFNGDVGIAVRDVATGWTTAYDGDTFFPQQSVSKFWVQLTALDRADQGKLNLTNSVTVGRDDLTLFHQPIRTMVLKNGGFTTTLSDLMHRAITQSDNTANDFVLWKAGGPDAVRAFLHKNGLDGIRFGPGERLLQTRIAGIEWNQSWATNNGFYTARSALPTEVRRANLERYIADPMDGATPNAVVQALARLKRGELLSPESTSRILGIMSNTRTGAQRLKGGLAPGWNLAHKTGTGQVLGAMQAGYNDIGLLTGPDGRTYAVAVLIRRTSAPLPQRMAMMQNVTRAVIDFDSNLEHPPIIASRPLPGRPLERTIEQPLQRAVAQPQRSLADELAPILSAAHD